MSEVPVTTICDRGEDGWGICKVCGAPPQRSCPRDAKSDTTVERGSRPFMHAYYLEEVRKNYPTAGALIEWQDCEINRLRLVLEAMAH